MRLLMRLLMLELRLNLRLLIQLMLLLELLELLAAIKSGRWPNDGGVLHRHRRGADAGRARVKQESRSSSTNCSGL